MKVGPEHSPIAARAAIDVLTNIIHENPWEELRLLRAALVLACDDAWCDGEHVADLYVEKAKDAARSGSSPSSAVDADETPTEGQAE